MHRDELLAVIAALEVGSVESALDFLQWIAQREERRNA